MAASDSAQAQVKITNGSVYRLFSMNSELALGTPGASTANHVQSDQETPTGTTVALTTAQCWQAVANGSNWEFKNVDSGQYLGVFSASLTQGDPIGQSTFNGTPAQNWTLAAQSDGSYVLTNVNSGMVMDVTGVSTSPGALVHQWANTGGLNQHWAFEEVAVGGALSRVYIGGGDNSPGAFDGYLANPSQWAYTRQSADGYYINNFALNTNTADATQNGNLSSMANLFTNKNAFYETDMRYPEGDDKVKIDILRANHFNVTYATVNYGYTAERATALKWRGYRPVLVLLAPWQFGGNFNNSSNATSQGEVMASDGSATDGPSGYFYNNTGGMQTGYYSLVQFTRAHGKLSELMMATYTSGSDSGTPAANGAAFLKAGQACVRDCENNGARPDLWTVSYYAAQLQKYAVTPESNADGSPAGTVTGLGFWLIHHLKDPTHYTQLEVLLDDRVRAAAARTPATPAERVAAAAGNLGVKETSYTLPVETEAPAGKSWTVNYRLHNTSTWLDICPVVVAHVDDAANDWDVRFTMNGHDVTRALTVEGGLVFSHELRLWPGASHDLQMTVTSRHAAAHAAEVKVSLLPNPAETLLTNERVAVRIEPAFSGPQVASVH